MPKVSVVITCYNLGKYLPETINSVLASDFQDFEIIVVNDGSTDEPTLQLLRETNWPRTVILRTENRGLPAARNYGIASAKGKYVLPLDADDLIDKTYLGKAVDFLEKHSEYKFVSCYAQNFGFRSDVYETPDFDLAKLLSENILLISSMFAKECWERVGGYAEDMKGYQDWELWIKFIEAGCRYAVIKEPLFFYRNRGDSMLRGSNKLERRLELYAQIIDKHPNLYAQNYRAVILEKDRKYFQLRRKVESLLPRRWYYFLVKIFKKKWRL